MATNLTVHGREALRLPISVDGTDLSTRVLFFEVSGTAIRKALIPDAAVSMGALVGMSRDEVADLPTTPTLCAVTDETDPLWPSVIFEGTIQRTGFTR